MTSPLPFDEESARQALRGVVDPELGDNIVDLGMVRSITIEGGKVTVEVALTIASCPLRAQLRNDVISRLTGFPGVDEVKVRMGEMVPEERSALMARARWKARESAKPTEVPANTRVLAISSGKGGVGKSSVTVNLAAALAAKGLAVGVLDADIAGFSIPRLLGIDERLEAIDGKIHPHVVPIGNGSLKVVSMGLIEGTGESQAVMLRGLMLNRAVQHFLEDVHWGSMDYLLIDMPPGTGDIQMGLARMLPRANMLVVTTPALAAQQVAARAVDMARRGYLRVAGIVENMSAFVCEHGTSYSLFGEGGGQRLSESTGVPLLASIPLDPAVAVAGDHGLPVVMDSSQSVVAHAFEQLADSIVQDTVPLADLSGCSTRLLDAIAAVFDEKPATETA